MYNNVLNQTKRHAIKYKVKRGDSNERRIMVNLERFNFT